MVIFLDCASKVVQTLYDDSILGNTIYSQQYENGWYIFCMKTLISLYFESGNNSLFVFKCVQTSKI